jgi:polyferredoxin
VIAGYISRRTRRTRRQQLNPRILRILRASVICLMGLLASSRPALACPVCFGQNDSPLASAMNLGIFMMLLVVAGVLAAFASFFIYLMRRQRLVAQQSEGTAR